MEIQTNLKVTASVDKLTILGDVVDYKFQTTLDNNNYGFIKNDGFAQYPYERNFYMIDGSLLQWASTSKMRALRYEFNPNNADKHREAVFEIIGMMKYPELSRVDIAIDIRGVDLSDYKVLYDKNVKRNVWVNGMGKLETEYIHAPNSDYRIRIYDKRLEQKIKDSEEWWRIEVQLRGEFCQRFKNGGALFNGLKFSKPNYKQIEDFQTRSAIYYLMQHPEEWKDLHRNTRSKYKKILTTLQSDEEIVIDELYQPHSQNIQRNIKDWLLVAERNNVI